MPSPTNRFLGSTLANEPATDAVKKEVKYERALMVAVTAGDLAECEKIWAAEGSIININFEGSAKMTFVNTAAAYGHKAVVEWLIGKKADIEKPNALGFRPLHSAALHGNESVVNVLLAAGARKHEKSGKGDTAATLAKSKGHDGIAAQLS